MDECTSFISFQESDDSLYFQQMSTILLVSPHQEDLGIPSESSRTTELDRNHDLPQTKGEKKRKSTDIGNGSGVRSDDNKEKKTVHRDIERRRRQEMGNLYSSLRMLLPIEFIKGKRALSDQINEAVKYIKYKEKYMEQLKSKRDKLRNMLDIGSDTNVPDVKVGTSRNACPIEISVRTCSHGGIEIMINKEVCEERCPLSIVLKVLVEEGFSVISCFCTKVNDKFLHTIQTEPSHDAGIDIRDLPRKISQRIKAPVNFK